MKLSEIPLDLGIGTVRDGAFAALGLISSEMRDILVFMEHDKYVDALLANGNVSCVIVPQHLASVIPTHLAVAISDDPRSAFYKLHNRLAASEFYWNPFPSHIA